MSTEINLNKNIYNSDGTVNSNRTVDLDGNTIEFDNGSVGINITPTVPLHIKSTAIPSTNENIVAIEVSDSPGAYFAIQNGTTADGTFQPKMFGRQSSSSNATAITYAGVIDSTQDSGTTPVVGFQAHLHTLAPIVTRPLFQFRNWATNIMTMLSNGNVGIGTATPGEKLEVAGKVKTTTFQMTTTPTAGYVMTSDASGNGTWSPASSSSGRFGIADSTGTYTYYTTLSAAITAAVSGQCVEFFTDYTETGNVPINLKDNVNINGNGHTYTCTYSAGAISLFVNTVGTQTISNLNIVGTGMNSSSTGFYINFTAQRTYFNGVVIRMDNGYGSYTFGGGIVEGLIVNVTGTTRGLGLLGGKYINCTAYSTNGEAIYCASANGTIENCRGESTGNVGIYGGGIYNSYGRGLGAGIWLQGGGGAYNCTGVSSSGYGIYITGGSAVHHNLTGISTASWGIRVFAPGIKINGFMAYSTAGYAFVGFDDTYAVNGYAESTASSSGYGGGQNMNTYFLSSWNNASGHAFTITAACQFVECVMETTSTSANAIYCASPVTIKYTGCKFKTSTTPVNANVSQGMINTEDAYGNVKL